MTGLSSLERQVAAKDAEIAQLSEQLRTEVTTLRELIQVTTRLNQTLNLSELLAEIVRAATGLLFAEAASILLIDEETGELTFEVAAGEGNQEVVKHRIPANQGIAGWVVQNGQPVRVDNPAEDTRHYQAIDQASGFETRNMLAVPLRVKDRIIGVAEVINKINAPAFSEADLELAQGLASQASVAVDRARMYARLASTLVASRFSYRL
jgi:sigma-B regulation protein RsbU (phosphoserine phosphatase)